MSIALLWRVLLIGVVSAISLTGALKGVPAVVLFNMAAVAVLAAGTTLGLVAESQLTRA